MTFNVSAEAYAKFMGRYAEPLAVQFLESAQPRTGHRVLDVGCGPGALTGRLVERLGVQAVSAIDPSDPFVAAVQARWPEIDVRPARAEQLPFEDDRFDLALAQLVVQFMTDPVAGLREMARVTRPGGTVAACVWDHAGTGGPLSLFWQAVHDTDPSAVGEAELPGTREGHLQQLFEQAGLTDVESEALTVRLDFATFDDWWQPFTLGVGPAGDYVTRLDERHLKALRTRCADLLPAAPFQVAAVAWSARGRA